MQALKRIDSSHHCEALVIHCIDFRFHEAIRDFVKNKLRIQSYDLLTIPGAVKHLTAAGSVAKREGVLDDIGISIQLHAPQQIILINHSDCGAYGGLAAFSDESDEKAAHRAALNEAAAVIIGHYPAIQVNGYYANLSGEKVSIN